MKSLCLLISLFLSFNAVARHSLGDQISLYIIDPKNKSKQKKKKNDSNDKASDSKVTEENRYTKDLGAVSYIALYFSNKRAEIFLKNPGKKLEKYYKSIEDKNATVPQMEVIFISKDINEKDLKAFSFPYMDYSKSKTMATVNKYCSRSIPAIVVINSSGQIVLRGQMNDDMVKKLEKIVAPKEKDKK
jgi:hypothetical protein